MARLVKWGNPQRGAQARASAPLAARQPSALPDVAFGFTQIDHQAGLARCLGNVDSYLKLLRTFHHEYRDFGRQCEERNAKGDTAGIRHLAHAIKGPAGSIGAAKLQAAANDLERAAWNSGDALDSGALASFRRALERVMEDIDPILCLVEKAMPGMTANAFDADRTSAMKLLGDLRGFLEKSDARAAAILPEFGPAQDRPELAEEWPRLRAHIGNFDFEEALETLNRIEERLHARDNLADGN